MSKNDKEIEALGYKIRVSDLSCGYIVYENKQSDKEVIIEWDDDEEYCMIFSQTISRIKDWYGQTFQEPHGLTIQEIELFTTKINELRNES
ncbi:hypothetical protein H8S51_005575 [Roseburia rectibacter]|uniref:hypothetical protein n=1 Tax=Roseburia rectibacter TaxID=2763062 RepID=UPI00164B49EE|nr:hypothetical protein [Roseburia rectibacter]UMZ01179.1 hypothetical protein H8S51_005575 [Roseburia rectibacter]